MVANIGVSNLKRTKRRGFFLEVFNAVISATRNQWVLSSQLLAILEPMGIEVPSAGRDFPPPKAYRPRFAGGGITLDTNLR